MTDYSLPVVYLAGPYSYPDPVENVHRAVKIAADLLDSGGCIPVVPHLSMTWHLIAPRPYEDWLAYDLHIMRRCDAVYRYSGESAGADAEVEEAMRLGIPVFDTFDTFATWAASYDGRSVKW